MVSRMQMALSLSALWITIFRFLDHRAMMSFKETRKMSGFFLDRGNSDKSRFFLTMFM